MMQSETFDEPSWPFFNVTSSNFDQAELCGFSDSTMDGSEFLPSLTETESSPVSSELFSFSAGEIAQFPIHGLEELDLELEFPLGLEEIENIWMIDEMESFPEQSDALSWQDLSSPEQSGWSPSQSTRSVEAKMQSFGLDFHGEDMEIDTQVGIVHLLKGYGEAMEEDQRELQGEISKCLSQKVSPVGGSLERLTYILTHEAEKQSDYLRQESSKNYEAASDAIYRLFPYGRVAHISANTAILEAVPEDAEVVHIVDFDLGNGVQWASVIEAVAGLHKTLKLTSIKFEEEEESEISPNRFEDIKRRLARHASSFGLNLKVEETKLDDLVSEMKKKNKRGGGKKEWVAFNCMVGLPHMTKRRSRKLAMEFQCLAKELMATNRGILTVGDGDACQNLSNCSSFGSFFEGCLVHYKALLESMEMTFPSHLREARLAMENLFVAPQICPQAWMRRWEEMREGCDLSPVGLGMEGRRLSRENVMEARELVRDGESLYGVKIEENQNEMVLEWRGTPLMRMSAWRI